MIFSQVLHMRYLITLSALSFLCWTQAVSVSLHAAGPVPVKGPDERVKSDGAAFEPVSDFISFQGRLYRVFNAVLSWQDARKKCEEMGGSLATANGSLYSSFLVGLAKKGGREGYWLGATDEKTQGKWTWLDGSPVRYSNWNPGQPNDKGKGENYMVLLIHHQGKMYGKWVDQPNQSIQHHPGFICEWR